MVVDVAIATCNDKIATERSTSDATMEATTMQ
jgi:hypothetical protein